MSFKQQRNKINVHHYRGGIVKPPHGSLNLYWWKKGFKDDPYIKADLYGLDAELIEVGLIGKTVDEIVAHIKWYYDI